MKKPYSEPDILFESFTLNTNIAAGCEAQPDTQNDKTCGIRFNFQLTIFTDDNTTNCNRTPEGTEFDGFCYHVNTGDLNVFFS